MREIKFRVWDKTTQKIRSWNFYWNVFITDIFENQKHLIPLQYTGLKDKNGKEIYEGDILKNEDYSGIRVMKWEEDSTEPFSFRYYEYTSDWEVIGNIYQNPELLQANEPPITQ